VTFSTGLPNLTIAVHHTGFEQPLHIGSGDIARVDGALKMTSTMSISPKAAELSANAAQADTGTPESTPLPVAPSSGSER
jgi:hypothetical protein